MYKIPACFVVALALGVGVLGCQAGHGRLAQGTEDASVRAEFDPGKYERMAETHGRVFWIDAGASKVRFYLWRGGLAAAEGHNHIMAVRKMEGAVFLPTDMLEDDAFFDIVFRAEDIVVDPADLRKALGGAFGTRIPSSGVAGTREHMLGKKALDADRFPTIGISSHKIYGEIPKLVLDTVITLHGVRQRRLIPVTVSVQGGRLTARGAFAIRQTDFGITPFSALAGALYVLDPVMIEFDLQAGTR